MRKKLSKIGSVFLSLVMLMSLVTIAPTGNGGVVEAATSNLFKNTSKDDWTLSATNATLSYEDGKLIIQEEENTSGETVVLYQNIELDTDVSYTCTVKATSDSDNAWVNAYDNSKWNDYYVQATSDGAELTFAPTASGNIGWSMWIPAGAAIELSEISLSEQADANLFKNTSKDDWTLTATNATLTYEDGKLIIEEDSAGGETVVLYQNIELDTDVSYTCTVKATSDSDNAWVNAFYDNKKSDDYYVQATGDGAELTFAPTASGNIGWSMWIPAGEKVELSDISLTVNDEIDAATALENLKTLIETYDALNLNQAEYTEKSWAKYTTALEASNAMVKDASSEVADVTAQIKALKLAKNSLKESVFVEKVEGIDDSFIRGVDISSYESIIESGATYKDEDGNVLSDAGFFKLLADSGVNYVRIKVWNDPYTYVDANNKEYSAEDVKEDEDGTLYVTVDGEKVTVTRCGYGGGNSDLDKAVTIGKLATDAGMKVLIDFHYSDFWADPERQTAPKAWKDMTLEQKETALYEYTKTSLETLKKAGVDVGMVQIGNETNHGIAGVYNNDSDEGWANVCKLYNAGSKAVREISEDIMVAVHFTDPQTAGNYDKIAEYLATNNVDYDVFASSYYPNIHGSMENITEVLNNVATKYNKKVMVAETSWAWTTTEDGDGHSNTFSVPTDSDYPISVQGQVNVVRDVVQAVANVDNNAGIGVFYWEPAWIPVQYAYDEDGNLDNQIYKSNQEKWEKYGSGWASSYAGLSYDSDNVGEWYGGSVKDNESFFDFNGEPLDSLTVFKDILTGKEASVVKLDVVKQGSVELTIDDIESSLDLIKSSLPETVVGIYNNSDRKNLSVTWNTDEVEAITEFGTYSINGTASYVDESGETATAAAVCSVTVLPDTILSNGDFEDGESNWIVTNDSNSSLVWDDTPLRGTGALHFYNASDVSFSIEQTVTVEKAGVYCASMQLQGGGSDGNENIKITLTNETQGTDAVYGNASLNGWTKWNKATANSVEAQKGDELKVCISVESSAGSWGSIDDVFLYATSTIEVEKEATPELVIDYINETLTGQVEGKTYIYTDAEGKTVEIGADYKIPASSFGSEINIVVAGDKDSGTLDSDSQKLAISSRPEAPKNVTATEESAKDKKDGTISGVDTTMEYRLAGSDTWNAVASTVITGLTAGKYEVRIKATEKTFAGVSCTVEVKNKEEQTTTTDVKPAEVGATVASAAGDKGTFTVTKAGSTPEVSYTAEKNATTVTIPATIKDANGVEYKVTSIVADSIKGSKKLKSVTIGSNVTSIPANAFKGCTSLTSVKISASVKTIGANAFSGDTKLKTVSMGSSVTTIGDKAFYNCKKLTKITIPKTVTKIGKQAFANCKALKTITIKTTKLTKSKVGSKAFKGINAKATIKVPKAKLKAYKTILKSRGVGSKVKIKKN
jgi:arabinogalactan endo-1,4-beta-galactosidase